MNQQPDLNIESISLDTLHTLETDNEKKNMLEKSRKKKEQKKIDGEDPATKQKQAKFSKADVVAHQKKIHSAIETQEFEATAVPRQVVIDKILLYMKTFDKSKFEGVKIAPPEKLAKMSLAELQTLLNTIDAVISSGGSNDTAQALWFAVTQGIQIGSKMLPANLGLNLESPLKLDSVLMANYAKFKDNWIRICIQHGLLNGSPVMSIIFGVVILATEVSKQNNLASSTDNNNAHERFKKL